LSPKTVVDDSLGVALLLITIIKIIIIMSSPVTSSNSFNGNVRSEPFLNAAGFERSAHVLLAYLLRIRAHA
jgi:hypothetical protein